MVKETQVDKSTWNRPYVIDDPLTGRRTYKCPHKACVFCDHCTDVWWDYSNGPYMMVCEIRGDVERGFIGECEMFIEEKEE